MIWIPLLLVIGVIAAVDIWTRVVSPVVILPLICLVLGGWAIGWWPLSLLGGVLAFVGTLVLKLPLGDVFGMALCGLLVGPLVVMSAILVGTVGLLAFLLLFGDRVSLVQHPFFPYLGALVVAFSFIHIY